MLYYIYPITIQKRNVRSFYCLLPRNILIAYIQYPLGWRSSGYRITYQTLSALSWRQVSFVFEELGARQDGDTFSSLKAF